MSHLIDMEFPFQFVPDSLGSSFAQDILKNPEIFSLSKMPYYECNICGRDAHFFDSQTAWLG